MKKIIKTTNGSDKHMGCSICGTTYSVGYAIIPQPSCKCGNVVFFDIDPNCVRAGLNWPFIMVDDENNWKEIVLKEIEQFGKPKYLTKNPNETLDEFDFKKRYYGK